MSDQPEPPPGTEAGGRGVGGPLERPFPEARWQYIGDWMELDLGRYRKRYRCRLARADDGSWQRVSVQQETRNGWDTVGKKVHEGIDIGRAIERLGLPEDRWAWRDGPADATPTPSPQRTEPTP